MCFFVLHIAAGSRLANENTSFLQLSTEKTFGGHDLGACVVCIPLARDVDRAIRVACAKSCMVLACVAVVLDKRANDETEDVRHAGVRNARERFLSAGGRGGGGRTDEESLQTWRASDGIW